MATVTTDAIDPDHATERRPDPCADAVGNLLEQGAEHGGSDRASSCARSSATPDWIEWTMLDGVRG